MAEKAQSQHVVHPLPPVFDERSRVLVLGSMPSPASRAAGFNYGHPQNRFWRVMAQLAGEPLPRTNERKRDFCLRHHIALWDVLAECDIQGASDASIANAVPNRLTDITRNAPIQAVFCTGAKAYELYNRLCAEEVGIPAVKLPSTSPANAACKMPRLLEAYAAIFEQSHPFLPPTLDVPEVVELEHAIAAAGTPLAELMDRAGTAVAWRVQDVLEQLRAGAYPPQAVAGQAAPRAIEPDPRAQAPLVVIMCGNGNNGGDGWVAAALLAQAGVPVGLLTARMPEDISAQPAHDADLAALETLRACGARVMRVEEGLPLNENGEIAHTPLVLVDDGKAPDRQAVFDLMVRAHVTVDAMLGTGGSGSAPRQPFLEWITAENRCFEHHASIAVDVPTGVDARTGAPAEPRIRADETVTMIVGKPGLAAPECGRVSVIPLAYIEPLLP